MSAHTVYVEHQFRYCLCWYVSTAGPIFREVTPVYYRADAAQNTKFNVSTWLRSASHLRFSRGCIELPCSSGFTGLLLKYGPSLLHTGILPWPSCDFHLELFCPKIVSRIGTAKRSICRLQTLKHILEYSTPRLDREFLYIAPVLIWHRALRCRALVQRVYPTFTWKVRNDDHAFAQSIRFSARGSEL